MAYLLAFLFNAALAFALSLTLASLLGPEAFGRYAIGLSIAIVVSTVFFDWLRLSTNRFQGERSRSESPNIRRTLDISYLLVAGILCLVTALLLPFEPGGLDRLMLIAAMSCGIFQGFFEYRAALARALFREASFVALGCLRGLLAFVFAAGAAYSTGNAAAALFATALGAAVPVLLVQHTLRGPAQPAAAFDTGVMTRMARYAVPLVVANALYQLMPLLNRALLAGQDGFVAAGYFSLVSELSTRLLQNLGMAIDVVLFQLAIRAEEREGRAAGEVQVSRNMGAVTAIVLPAAAGLCAVWPAFEGIFVPQSFRGHLDGIVPLLVPALAVYSLILFAASPFFQMRHRTLPVIAAALAALLVNLGMILIWPRPAGPEGFALAQLCGVAVGLLVTVAIAIRQGARLPWRDLALAVLASGLMLAAVLPLRGIAGPVATLALQVLGGGAVYGTLCLLFDLCGARSLLRNLVAQRSAPPGATNR